MHFRQLATASSIIATWHGQQRIHDLRLQSSRAECSKPKFTGSERMPIADIIQALTLLVTTVGLLVLAAQVRHLRKQVADTNRDQRTSQYLTALNLMFDWRSEIISAPELADRLHKVEGGSPYFKRVLDKHGVASYFHTLKLFHIFEVYFILHREGVINGEMWEGWKNNVSILMTPQANQELWAEIKQADIFNKAFVEFVDGVVKRKAHLEQ